MVTPNGDFWDSFDCEIQCEEYYQEDLSETENNNQVPSTSGLSRCPFTAESWVQIPLGSLYLEEYTVTGSGPDCKSGAFGF